MRTYSSAKFPSVEATVFTAKYASDISAEFQAECYTYQATLIEANSAALYPAVLQTKLQALGPAF
jgi:hypothetical protein